MSSILVITAIVIAHNQNTKLFDRKSFIENGKNYNFNIIRDIYGVPHITGEKDKDAAF